VLLEPKSGGARPKKFFTALGSVPPTFKFVPALLTIGLSIVCTVWVRPVYIVIGCLMWGENWRASNITLKNLTELPLNTVNVLNRTFHIFCTCVSAAPRGDAHSSSNLSPAGRHWSPVVISPQPEKWILTGAKAVQGGPKSKPLTTYQQNRNKTRQWG